MNDGHGSTRSHTDGGNAAVAARHGVRVPSSLLLRVVQAVFETEGFSAAAAAEVAGSLVDSERAGVSSHGINLVPMYLERIRFGSVSRCESAEVVDDGRATAVLDAHHALGQLTSHQAMASAIGRAKDFGVGAVTVRHAFHFGRASRYACQAADAGCIGIALSNTRPMMPGIGGAEPLVGNNPLAVAVPQADGTSVVLDMATSEAALGKIRLAAAEGRSIPLEWATDASGMPTTDPQVAIDGLLLPFGGAKGFGIALIIEVLTGVLSGGAFGSSVHGLYSDMTVPNDCAHFFAAIDVGAFGTVEDFATRMGDFQRHIHESTVREGAVGPVLLPGEPEQQRMTLSDRDGVVLEWSALDGLIDAAAQSGTAVDADDLRELRGLRDGRSA